MTKKAPEFDLSFLTPPWLGLKSNAADTSKATVNSIEEFDKKIKELKSVEQWLNLNIGILQSTIQGLEVQRNTIIALTAATKSKKINKNDPTAFASNKEFSNIMANATSLWWSNVEEQMEKFLKTNSEDDLKPCKNEPAKKRKKKTIVPTDKN
jgi:hypothetical protein